MSMSYTHIMPGASLLANSTKSISREAKIRLKWMDYFHKHKNVSLTCRYFGISRKTFYKWKKQYNPFNLSSLEDRSKKPKNNRQWEVRRKEELRIISLRRSHIRYGKMKLQELYKREYNEYISSWKIQRVIEKHNIYFHPIRTKKLHKKHMINKAKKRITELKKEKRTGFLVSLDTVIRYWNGSKRYILTAIDIHSKIGFARMYSTKHSKNTADFLKRIHYLFEGKIENIQTDNGAEFAKDFKDMAKVLNIPHYFSRSKTPTDNSFDERFNRTLNEEFIEMGNMTSNCDIFNKNLLNWLIEYNFKRPHQTLGYDTPVEYHYKHNKVLPMYPSSTKLETICFFCYLIPAGKSNGCSQGS